jgi:hypothetical protein
MKTIDTLKAYIKIGNKIISFDMKKRMKHKTLGFKCDTPIMLGPIIWVQFTHMDNVIFHS